MAPKDQINFIPRIDLKAVQDAYDLIKNDIVHTDTVSSPALNKWLGHKVYFKLENQQKTGSFKFRGALYSVLKLKDNPPERIVTYGTGNHAVGLAWAASRFLNISITAFLTDFTSTIKKKLATEYGANVILTKTREEAEQKAKSASKIPGTVLLPPSDGDDIIAGAGTVMLEVLNEKIGHIDAVFLPIGGGSIASGTVIVAKALSPETKLYGAEPKSGNDAAISYRTKKIFRFTKSPETLADGAKTPGISERVFQYIQDLDDIYEISEREIGYWTVWLTKIFNQKFEPTASLSMSAAFRWLKEQHESKNILVIITGQNINEDVYDKLLAENYLDIKPNNFECGE